MNMKLINIIVIILLFATIVNGLGLEPAINSFYFEENLEREVQLTILNNENKDLEVAIYAKGSLAKYIEIPVKKISMTAEESSKQVLYRIKLPQQIDPPGKHESEVIVREADRETGNMQVSAIQAIVHKVELFVPYPTKYLEARLDIVGGKTESKATFYIPLQNHGEEDINEAKADIIIMDLYDNFVDKTSTGAQKVSAKSKAELSAEMDLTELVPGIYRVIANVSYDGLTTIAENTLYKWDFLLIPLDISVKEFKLGEIAEFDVLVENVGNIKIKDAYSIIILNSKDGKEVANFKSPSIDFEPLETKEVTSHWNTESVKEDNYIGKLILRYSDKSSTRGISAEVGKDYIKAEIIGVTGYAISEEQPSPEFSLSTLVIILIISLFAINIGWFVFYFMSRKKKK